MSTLEIVDFVLTGVVVVLVVGGLVLLWIKVPRDELKEMLMAVWFGWLFAGWAPIVLVMVTATSKTGMYVWVGMLGAYILAWMPVALSD